MKENLITIFLLVIVGISGLISLWPKQLESGAIALENPTIKVFVVGEVKKPGVYQLPFGSRVENAIKLAGGLTNNAEKSFISMANILDDEQKIVISSKRAINSEIINLNTASSLEIESLPGIGPALAERIIAGRPYGNIKDLDKIKGIGPKLIEKLSNLVEF